VEQAEALGAVCVRVSTLGVCLIHVSGHMYRYARGVYVCSVHVCLLGMRLQPRCWLDPGTWS